MNKNKVFGIGVLLIVLSLLIAATGIAQDESTELNPIEMLGKAIFFDTSLSAGGKQSCATCHAPEVGFTGPDSLINLETAVYPGAVATRFGNRKPPTAAYGGKSPVLYYDPADEVWVGGMFWDGRATGWELGDPLAEQAQGPFLNPVEQALPKARSVCLMIMISDYADLFEEVWGPESLDCVKDVAGTYERIARSISAYEKSIEVNPFSSKFDIFWDNARDIGMDATTINVENYHEYAGLGLTYDELYGFAVFNDEDKGKCALCHTLDEGDAGYPLFTDFTYDNLGIPRNEDNPFYDMPPAINRDGEMWTDFGLGAFLEAAGFSEEVYTAEYGKHKVPTLRNVDKRPYPEFVKAYGHNGFFKSLEEITHFYNTRDVPTEMWPVPEIPYTVNTDELGNLGLSMDEEEAIVLFMTTLSDQ
jgi:cytochrome c peroxidase